MPGYLTSSTLIEDVKRSALIPTSQSTFTEADFLAFANQEMRIGLVPSIMLYHQEYFVRDSSPITLVANQSSYPIPYRAVGGKFRELFYLDTNSNLVKMTRISPDERPFFQQSNISNNNYIYFYIQGNEVVIAPSVGSNPVGSLVFSFWMRPNELVNESRVATIVSISVGVSTTTYTVDQIPTGFTTNVLYDLMQTNPGHKTINFDLTASSVDTTNKTITFTTTNTYQATYGSNVGSTAVVGDYISFAGECIIPQAPSDLHDVLAQRVVTRCLQALGDQVGIGMAQGKLQEMEKNTAILTDNRSEGQPIKANNISGLLKGSRVGRGWYS